MDIETEQKVWERVSGQEPESLRGMEMRCWESSEAFRQMTAAAPIQIRERLRHLSKKSYANAMTIRGMRVLSGEEPEAVQQKGTQIKTGLRRGLAQCFRRCQQARADYLAYRGEYTPIFQMLAHEEEKTMQEILSLIGGE